MVRLEGKGKIPEFLKNIDEDNPLFSRLFSSKKDFSKKTCLKISEIMSNFVGAEYAVVGHSPFKEINETCGEKIIRTDVMLSRAFGGTLNDKKYQALEIKQFKQKPPEKNVIETKI